MKIKLPLFACIVLASAATQYLRAQVDWHVNGNAGTTASNFLGTTDAKPIIFKTSGIERMRLSKTGNLGIGLATPNFPLHIVNPSAVNGISVTNTFPSNSDHVGVFSSSVIAPGWGYGIQASGGFYGISAIGAGGNYTGSVTGVYGEADGSTGSRYGVYGFASGGSFNAAGYFDGAVWAVSYNLISDRKVKTNITPLQNSLGQLMKLKPSAYEFNAVTYSKMGLPKGKQIGLIADEVKQVFPELVNEAVHPAQYDKDKVTMLRPEEKYEGVNYIGLIPVLIASVQEQQKVITDLKSKNEELQSRLDKLELLVKEGSERTTPTNTVNTNLSLSSARLEQNMPNPFHQTTLIKYYLPNDNNSATINISDASGKVIKSTTINSLKGNGQLTLEAGQLTPGTYQYSLIVNGKVLDSKKMVVTK